MTIISNHRNHTYKASASIHRRDISPKKINIQKNTLNKKMINKSTTILHTQMLNTIDASEILPSLVSTITNYLSDFTYKVLMPTEYQCEEEPVQDEMTDDDYEDMWNHYDYLEWLYD